MEFRRSNTLGVDLSRIGLGCVTFGREIDEATSFEIMETAAAEEINLFDTAAAYGNGTSERIVGRWLLSNRCRNEIVLQTKVKPPFTRKAILESFGRSLERLQTDGVDIYLLHEYDTGTDLLETLEVLTELAESKRVRSFGCSNFSLVQLQNAESISKQHGLRSFGVIQPAYSLLAREIEAGTIQYCAEQAIDVVTYSPLAAGFLTGKYSEVANTVPCGSRFDVAPGHRELYFSRGNFLMLQRLRHLATADAVSMGELALGWVLQNSAVMSVLVGATSITHIKNAAETLKRATDPQFGDSVRGL